MTGNLPSPTLYILMRTDMASMNPGKAMAQAAHASNRFVRRAFETGVSIADWETCERAFGTTLVLAVKTEREMREVVKGALEDGFVSGIVHDPTYPIRDGGVTHYVPVDTCAFIFTPCRHASPPSSLAGLSLHP